MKDLSVPPGIPSISLIFQLMARKMGSCSIGLKKVWGHRQLNLPIKYPVIEFTLRW
jgi:hypothetical protein